MMMSGEEKIVAAALKLTDLIVSILKPKKSVENFKQASEEINKVFSDSIYFLKEKNEKEIEDALLFMEIKAKNLPCSYDFDEVEIASKEIFEELEKSSKLITDSKEKLSVSWTL